MATWTEFTENAPRISTIFKRRHAATGKLCMLATLRADGSPRISPMEPQIFEDHLLLIGMPGTRKFDDLRRDPRFSLHTATVDPQVGDGDAKLWGVVRDANDAALFERFAVALLLETGMDLLGETTDHFYIADIQGASSLELSGEHLDVTIWKPGEAERVVEKH